MFLKPKKQTTLDFEIDRAVADLCTTEFASEEYDTKLERVTKLYKLKENTKPSPVSQDTLVLAGTNLLGLLLIISTEREHVITTKALGMLQRTKN